MLCHMHDLYMEIFFHFGWLLTCHNWESLARCNIINNCWIHLICTFISYTRHTRSFLFQISQAISLLLNAHRHHTPRRTWGWIVVETNVKHYLWWFLFTVCDAVPFSFRLCFLLLVWSYSDNITHITTILNQKSLFVCWPKSETMVGFQHRGGCRVTPWSCVWRWWFGLWERRPTMTTYNYLQLQIIKNPTWKRGKGRRSGSITFDQCNRRAQLMTHDGNEGGLDLIRRAEVGDIAHRGDDVSQLTIMREQRRIGHANRQRCRQRSF